MADDSDKIQIRRGLKEVYFDRSQVCFIDGRAGELRYRGYSIHDLAETGRRAAEMAIARAGIEKGDIGMVLERSWLNS